MKRAHRSRVLGIAVVSMISVVTAGTPVLASGPPGKGPAHPPPAVDAEACSLRAPHRSPHDEWLRCLRVEASLSRIPAVGQEATLTAVVTSDADRSRATFTIELPANLAFADSPARSRVTTGRATGGLGVATRAATTLDLEADGVRRLTATIRAIAAGPAHVRVNVRGKAAWGTDAASDDLFLTIGSTAAASRVGFDPATLGGVTRAQGDRAPAERARRAKAVPLRGLPRPHTDDPPAPGPRATSCASGSWHFLDQNGALQPSVNYQVQVWDDDGSSGDDLLVSGVTNFSGGYNLCFNGSDGAGGGQEVYVRFISSNSLWRVRNTPAGNTDYVNSTGVQAICDGCNASFGAVMPGNDIHRGMNAFDATNDAWVWVPSTCWDGNDGTCRQVVINWTATSTDGTFYSLAGNDVHLAADDPNAPTVVIHEVGHGVMDDVYEDDFPPNPNCQNHPIRGVTSTGCAWTEGWAEWFPASVLNDPFFRWPDGSSLDLENATWGSAGWANGDAVEGRVAGALIDISDFANEASWDRYGEGDPGNIWTTFINNISDTMAEFWADRAAGGFNTANSGANGSVYQNTIDYTFRDPLGNYAELTRPTPTPHNYSYSTSSVYWSAVAVRPPAGTDYDMTLYDDVGQTVNLGGSAFGGSTIDFVAVDSNHRALGDYYPRIYQFSLTGTYQVELAQGANQLNVGSQTVFMGANDVILIRDTSQTASVPTFFRVVPSGPGQDPELLLMQSDGANSATWVRSRGSAVASSTANGAGVPEGFSYTPPASDWYGLVLTNKAGSGNYTLHVDTSAPTGSLVVNGGAAATAAPDVTVDLSAADGQTGVEAMRISTDGTMDSEPFVAYSATQPATLTAGDGTKTVLAQFRNGAGMTSAVVSDTIVLDTTDPVAVAPAALVKAGPESVTDTGDVRMLIEWSATDALTGVAAYELGERLGAGAWNPVGLPSPTSTSVFRTLTPGGTQYRYRQRATDGVGNTSAFVAGPSFRVQLVEQTAASIAYSTGWTTVADPDASGGNVARANLGGKTATYSTPNARHIAVVARKGPNAGIAKFYVDGVLAGTIDLYSATVQDRTVVFRSDVTPGVPHDVQVRVTPTKNPASSGSNVFLDAFVRMY